MPGRDVDAAFGRGIAIRNRQLAEFMPGVLAVREQSPSPLGRATLWCLTALVAATLVWACYSEVSVVAEASGRVITSGRSKIVQSPADGVVTDIRIREGQAVKAGELLIGLDPTLIEADRARLESEHHEARQTGHRLRSLLLQLQDTQWLETETHGDKVTSPSQSHLIASQLAQHRAQLESDGHEIRTQERMLEQTLSLVSKLAQTLPLVEEQAAKLKYLVAEKLQPRLNWLDVEKRRIEHLHDLKSAEARAAEIRSRIAMLEQDRTSAVAAFRADLLDQWIRATHALEKLESERLKLEERRARHLLVSPVDGVVQQVGATSDGAVVSKGQTLVTLVPLDEKLELEAQIRNRDIGFVSPGQPARIKLEAFPFTRYGVIEGTVRHVSQDAIESETGELVFPARVELEAQEVRIAGNAIRLTPGMTARVEVTTGTRTIMDYLISPLMRFKDESFQER
jgi:hemolysin D